MKNAYDHNSDLLIKGGLSTMTRQTAEIMERARRILDSLPSDVMLVAAAKGRTTEQVQAAIDAGITHIGHNYIQEALPMIETLRDHATWHMIGHLQRNKAKKAIQHFDMIETLDSPRLARELERRCKSANKVIPVLIEINSGRESSKTGIHPGEIDEFVQRLPEFQHICVEGLMTMGPRFGDPEDARPYFQATREAFERLAKLNLPNVSMRYLSMGMSNSYHIALEEGANVIRIGTKIFGEI
jgi:pyridoxal phosphate enzyme (YggS family)